MRAGKCFFTIGIVLSMVLSMAGCAKENATTTTSSEHQKEETATPDTTDSVTKGVVDLTTYVTIGEYKGIKVQRVTPEKVTDKEVTKQIRTLMSNEAGEKKEKEGSIRKGDYVVVSFQGYYKDSVVEEAKMEDMTLRIGEYVMLPDFEDGLIGAKKGDILTIEVKIPEDYDETYAGQKMEYDVKISDVYRKKVPEITDANVKKYLDAESVKQLHKELGDVMRENRQQEATQQMYTAAMNQVISEAKVSEYPEKYLKQFVDEVKAGYETAARERNESLEQYIQELGLNSEEFEAQVEQIAKQNLKQEMVYQAIIKKEGLTLSDQEKKEGAGDYVDGVTYKSVEEVLEKADSARLEQRILYKKAFELVGKNTIVKN